MKNVFRIFVAALVAGSMHQLALAQGAPQSPAAINTQDRQAIEEVVKQYLMKNPSIIRDAMVALQAQEEADRQQQTAGALKSFNEELHSDKSAPVAGNPKGDVTIVEFFDYNCGYCKKVAPALAEIKKRDPNVRVVYKEFPILSPQSVTAAKAALAAQKQGKFTEFHEALMSAAKVDDSTIKTLSQKLKLDYNKLQKDMADPALDAALEKNHQQATALNINGTPAFIIGDRLIPGAADVNQLMELVQAERQKKKSVN